MSGSPDQLAALHASAFAAPWRAADIAALLSQPGVFAVDGPDGFILVRTAADEAEILTLAVRPEARRRGVAAGLVEAAAVRAAGLGAARLFLEVDEANAAARALYARAGFAEAGRRPGYYARPGGGRGDALLLVRNFDQALPTPGSAHYP